MTSTTRNENILDLFLIDNPTLVKSVEVRPGIADHDFVLSEVFIKPQISRHKPQLIFMYKKADWEGLETHMLAFQKSFCPLLKIELSTHFGRILRGPYIVVLSSMFPSELSVLSHHCTGSHKTLGGQCATGTICSINTNSTDAQQTDKLTLNPNI